MRNKQALKDASDLLYKFNLAIKIFFKILINNT